MIWPEEIVEKIQRSNSKRIACFGKLVTDEVHLLPGDLVPGGHIPAERTLAAGGAPANISVMLARKGYVARMTGWIGNDPMAQGIAAFLAEAGIDIRCKIEGSSPKATVLVYPNAERALLTDDGVGGISPHEVKKSWFEDVAIVHLDGYDIFRERFPDSVVRAAEVAHSLGKVVSIDMGAGNRILDFGAQEYLEVVHRMQPDIIFANAEEANALRLNSQRLGWLPVLAVHRADKPTRVSVLRGEDFKLQEFSVPERKIIDSTGCGDAFAAGMLASLVDGLLIEDAVDRAHAWAQEVGMILGAQPSFADSGRSPNPGRGLS